MGIVWPKIIRDPVHNIISFEDDHCDKLLLELINTREFQRLRRIKQLGMSDLVFPGANHSRFAHSIGTMHIARKMYERIKRVCGNELPEESKSVVLSAALLHDIGHGPFSHAFEKITETGHEELGRKIILDESSEVNKRLRGYNEELPKLVVDLSDGDYKPEFLSRLVSSQLDADRLDYLLRDSHATGTIYGDHDIMWLIQHLQVDENKKRCYLDRKCFSSAEQYVYSRYHMYKIVYFHKTVRAAEVMLKLAFERYKELLESAASYKEKLEIAPNAPKGIFRAFSTGMDLGIFLELDDYTVYEFLKTCIESKDDILKKLGSGLINRKLYKCTDVTSIDNPNDIVIFASRAKELLEEKGFDSNYCWGNDTAADIPYKPYHPVGDNQETQIFVELANGKLKEISQESYPVKELTRKYAFTRYYYPEEVRNSISDIANQTFRRGS